MTENNERRCNSIEISEGTENILNSKVDTSCMHTHFIFVDLLFIPQYNHMLIDVVVRHCKCIETGFNSCTLYGS